MRIGNREIGINHRPYIIAEIGVNHDGDADRAKLLARDAADAGADAVKLQYFHPQRLLSNQAGLAEYQAAADETDVADMLGRLTLGLDEVREVVAVVRELGLKLVVTPFSEGDVDDLAELDLDAVKIASPDAVNPVLLEKAAGLGVPLLISTGTCDLDELQYAAELLQSHEAGGAFLQCVSSYPTPADQAALAGIAAMQNRFGLPVGYSDHTQEIITGALAVAAGACVVEKHLTHNRNASGPDHAVSFEPDELADYIVITRQAEAMLGPIAKDVQPVEREVRNLSRQSVAIKEDLKAGEILQAEHLEVRRPGTGVPAMLLHEVIGKTLAEDKTAHDILFERDLI